jgi:glycosyltransferase involved in cell wall biosynthesis
MSHSLSSPIPVVIASTLKPVNDIRAYEKVALSLGETNKYQLNIIGFFEEKLPENTGIRFFSGIRHYNSITERILIQFKFSYQILKIKPKLVICCTYELIPVASLLKALLKFKLVYDVQENYRCNLNLNPNLLGIKKKIACFVIKWAERVPGIELFLLAEKCYRTEMPEKAPFLILENKHSGEIEHHSTIRFEAEQPIKFCITGTLSPFFGTLDGIHWFKNLINEYPNLSLQIIGHCPFPKYSEEILKVAKGVNQIHIEISQSPLSHDRMIQTLRDSDISLLPYRSNKCFQNKIPTKLFECAALGLPVFMTPNPVWEIFFGEYQGGFPVDFGQPQHAVLTFKKALKQTYFSRQVSESVLWKNDKIRFQKAIEELLHG